MKKWGKEIIIAVVITVIATAVTASLNLQEVFYPPKSSLVITDAYYKVEKSTVTQSQYVQIYVEINNEGEISARDCRIHIQDEDYKRRSYAAASSVILRDETVTRSLGVELFKPSPLGNLIKISVDCTDYSTGSIEIKLFPADSSEMSKLRSLI